MHTALYAEATNLPEYYVNWLSLKLHLKLSSISITKERYLPTDKLAIVIRDCKAKGKLIVVPNFPFILIQNSPNCKK